MSNNIAYDFTLDSLVSVDAPIGTDPATLVAEAKSKFLIGLLQNDAEVIFDTIFDAETGAYSTDWKGYSRKEDE